MNYQQALRCCVMSMREIYKKFYFIFYVRCTAAQATTSSADTSTMGIATTTMNTTTTMSMTTTTKNTTTKAATTSNSTLASAPLVAIQRYDPSENTGVSGNFLERLLPVLLIRIRIRIRRIRMFLGLLDPDPNPLVRCMDPDPDPTPDPDPFITKQKPWFLLLCDFFFDFLYLKNDVNLPSKSNKQKNFFKTN
jgi:hypothetical protein